MTVSEEKERRACMCECIRIHIHHLGSLESVRCVTSLTSPTLSGVEWDGVNNMYGCGIIIIRIGVDAQNA